MADPDERAFLEGGGATGALIAALDWAATPLGPISGWPQSLKTTAAILLRSSVPMALLWGQDGVILYNDAYAAIVGRRHPKLLGSKIREGWPALARFNDYVLHEGLSGRTLAFRDHEIQVRRSERAERIWLNLDYSPVLDEAGRPAGVLAIIVETTERILTERKAASEAARQRRLFEQAPGFINILRGPDHVFEFVNEAHKRLFGDRDLIGKPARQAMPVIDEHLVALLDQVYATGERYVAHAEPMRLRNSAGREVERFVDFVYAPITDDAGQVTGIFCEGFDVTDQVRAERAVAESERRLSAAITVARLGAFEWELDTGHATLDQRAREIFGFPLDQELTVKDVVGRIDPRDLPRLYADADPGTARREFEYRVRRPDGSIRTVVSLSDTFLGPDGQAQRIIGVFDDVTERRRAENRQRLLINELNHRVKNTLATVQSIAAQTLRSARDLASAREAFEERLVALAAAHDLLTAESWHGARVGDIAASALAPFESLRRSQISRSGPSVRVSAQRALALSMAFHELATNAAKYGALSRPEGRVTVRWAVGAQDELILTWIEQGGPRVATPERSGFGSRLLQRSLARELDGQVAFTFAPEGVRCEIRFKLAEATMPEMIEV